LCNYTQDDKEQNCLYYIINDENPKDDLNCYKKIYTKSEVIEAIHKKFLYHLFNYYIFKDFKKPLNGMQTGAEEKQILALLESELFQSGNLKDFVYDFIDFLRKIKINLSEDLILLEHKLKIKK